MSRTIKKLAGCLLWVLAVLGVVIALLAWNAGQYTVAASIAEPMGTVSYAKILLLRLYEYAHAHDDRFPDAGQTGLKSANDVFRELFKKGFVTDERLFAPRSVSVFKPDRQIGTAPEFKEALRPGECQWMLLKGQGLSTHPKTPILIESALQATWPPRWDVSPPPLSWFGLRKAEKGSGQAWRDRQVVVGRNEGSVSIETLRPDGTFDWHSAANLDEHGKSWIDYLTPEQIAKLEYWDIEERETP